MTSPHDIVGLLTDFDTFAIHDGPGIRATYYLKGCPLSCAWCHSPETQGRERELIFVRERCILCGACVEACERGVHRLSGDVHSIARELCRACGACVMSCTTGALSLKGYEMTAAEAIARAVRLKPFFQHSGGGVTLTGGEVTLQPDWAEAVLAGCQAAGIHTAIETSGACAWSVLERLLAHTDLILYDLKLMDDAAHRRWVGASNRQILENAARLTGRSVQVRVPMIPKITDTDENLRAILRFMADAGLRSVALLPYNEAAGAKYEWLGQEYRVQGARQSPAFLHEVVEMAQRMGIAAVIG